MTKRSEVGPSRGLGDSLVLWSTVLNISSFIFSVLNQDICEINFPSIFVFTVLDCN